MLELGQTLELPPFIDGHVHFREPGNNPAETIASGTLAAAYGGVGMVADMSNNAPYPTSTVEAMLDKHDIIARDARVKVGTAAGAQPEYDNLGELEGMLPHSIFVKLYGGPTTNIDRPTDYEAAEFDPVLDRIAELEPDKLVVFHSGQDNYRDFIGHAAGDRGLRVRLAHVNKIDQVNAVKEAQAKGLRVRAAICPHTLLLNSNDRLTRSSFADMQPPLVDQIDADELFAAFAKGDIEELETDHAPHAVSKKMGAAIANPSCTDTDHGARCCGVPGIELAGPLMLWQVYSGRLSLSRLVDSYSKIPAYNMRLRHHPQSKVVWQMDPFTVGERHILSGAGWTPYLGMMAIGRVVDMQLADRPVMQSGHCVGSEPIPVTGNNERI